MNNNISLISIIVILLLTFSFIFPSIVSAHPLRSGETPNVWSGRLLPGFCPHLIFSVHDARGNIFSSFCNAAAHGVRVTWDGVHDDDNSR